MEKTLREHLKEAAQKRWEGKTAEERSAHGRMMRERRRENEKNKMEVQRKDADAQAAYMREHGVRY